MSNNLIIGSTSQCYFLKHNSAVSDGENKGSFYLNRKTLEEKKFRKIFITPSGKIHDSGPIFK